MMRPRWILRLYRSELTKYSRQRFTIISLALLTLIAVVLSLTFDRMMPSENLTGFLVLNHVTVTAVGTIIHVLVIIFCSMLVAGETSGGTFRMILSRPVTRAEFLTAKVMMGLTFAVVILFWYELVSVISIGIGSAYDFGPVIEDGEVVISSAAIASNFILALLLTLLPLMADVAYGILMSVFARSLSTAIGVAIGVLFGLDAIKHPLHIDTFVFSTHVGEFLHISDYFALGNEPVWFDPDPALSAMLTLAVTIVFFLAIAYFIFLRRDLNE